jgi:photosystem II stability/assembly factor-like uncharacterized protein
VSFTLSFDTPPVHGGLLDFIDPLYGWVLASHSAAMGHHPEALYQTTNAGISWKDINDAYGPVGGLPDEAGVTSMVFEDTTRGWMTLDYEFGMGSGLLFYTQDGGATWTDVAENLPHPSDAAHICSYDHLRLFKPGSLTFIAGCTDRGEKTAAYVYHTENDGKTWQMVSANPQWVGAITKPSDAFYLSGSPDIQMFSATLGWMVALDNRVYKTLDGGKTWTEVAPLPDALKSIPAAGDTPTPPTNPTFDFVDAKSGWVIDLHGGLNVTTDGGQTWTLLKPVIAPS